MKGWIYIRKTLRYMGLLLLSFLAFVLLYGLCVLLFAWIPVNTEFVSTENGIELYVQSNGMHVDIVVPVKTPQIDWTTEIDVQDFDRESVPFEYIAIGWGDKGFYLETPEWENLKVSVAFKALFLPSPTAMHVTYKTTKPRLTERCKKVRISPQQCQALITYIKASFATNANGQIQLIDCCRYPTRNDAFYEANGSYTLFKTCNNWTNQALKVAGVKTAFWAPLSSSVLYHMP